MKVRGFSIIELMISILILSILATISFSVYQRFYSKSLLTSCLAEISHARMAYEITTINEKIIPANTLSQLNINLAKSCKSHKLELNKIIGIIKDGKNISGSRISLDRDTNTKEWSCYLYNTPPSFSTSYLPNGCTLK